MASTNTAASLFNVSGMVAVITGGGSGLGLYAARALDANGAKAVYIIGRRAEVLENAAKTGVNGTIKPLVGDISSKESIAALVKKIEEEEGFVNFLFANAGVIGPPQGNDLKKAAGEKSAPSVEEFSRSMFEAGDMQAFSQALHVNCTGLFFTVAAFLPLLAKGNEKRNLPQDSQVLVTSSVAGFSRVIAASFCYSASKAGATHLVKTLSTYFAQSGYRIRVNLIAPGLYPSEMTTGMTDTLKPFAGVPGHDGAFADARTMPLQQCPAGRTGSEEDIAGTVLFMASRAGAYLNGEALVTDGGRLAQMPSVY